MDDRQTSRVDKFIKKLYRVVINKTKEQAMKLRASKLVLISLIMTMCSAISTQASEITPGYTKS